MPSDPGTKNQRSGGIEDHGWLSRDRTVALQDLLCAAVRMDDFAAFIDACIFSPCHSLVAE